MENGCAKASFRLPWRRETAGPKHPVRIFRIDENNRFDAAA